jgi:hypothetical protein
LNVLGKIYIVIFVLLSMHKEFLLYGLLALATSCGKVSTQQVTPVELPYTFRSEEHNTTKIDSFEKDYAQYTFKISYYDLNNDGLWDEVAIYNPMMTVYSPKNGLKTLFYPTAAVVGYDLNNDGMVDVAYGDENYDGELESKIKESEVNGFLDAINVPII